MSARAYECVGGPYDGQLRFPYNGRIDVCAPTLAIPLLWREEHAPGPESDEKRIRMRELGRYIVREWRGRDVLLWHEDTT